MSPPSVSFPSWEFHSHEIYFCCSGHALGCDPGFAVELLRKLFIGPCLTILFRHIFKRNLFINKELIWWRVFEIYSTHWSLDNEVFLSSARYQQPGLPDENFNQQPNSDKNKSEKGQTDCLLDRKINDITNYTRLIVS